MTRHLPRHVYCCPVHGEFNVYISFKDEVPETTPCEAVIDFDHGCDCGKKSKHVLKAPAAAYVKGGGTGGGQRKRS